jgi:hypothetical protein
MGSQSPPPTSASPPISWESAPYQLMHYAWAESELQVWEEDKLTLGYHCVRADQTLTFINSWYTAARRLAGLPKPGFVKLWKSCEELEWCSSPCRKNTTPGKA